VGQNAHADLVFGVHLGGSDEGWLLTEPLDAWSDVRLEAEHLPWLTPEQVEEFDDYGYHEILELGLKHLATVPNRQGGQPLSDGLEVHQHGYELNSFSLVLSEPQFRVDWGDAPAVDVPTLQRIEGRATVISQFRQVFEALNLKPMNLIPRWFLTCEYF
jgi:hypothetical protein